jgi:hypothetical protein
MKTATPTMLTNNQHNHEKHLWHSKNVMINLVFQRYKLVFCLVGVLEIQLVLAFSVGDKAVTEIAWFSEFFHCAIRKDYGRKQCVRGVCSSADNFVLYQNAIVYYEIYGVSYFPSAFQRKWVVVA